MLSAVSPNSNHVFSILTYLLQAGEQLTVMIPYKALLLTQEVRTLEIGADHLVLQAPNQRLCSSIQERVYLYTERSPQGVTAIVREMNLERGIITLAGFRFIDTPWYKRRSDRVEPEKPTHLLFKYGENTYKARLADLSLHGLGVLIYMKQHMVFPDQLGEKLQVELKLEPDIPLVKLVAELVSCHTLSDTLTRLGLATSPRGVQKTLLSQYVAGRRHDILSELENVSSHVMDPRCSKDLYF
jgi:hypothetical protein